MAAHSYESAFKILYDLRNDINEYTSGLWLGTDTSGKYTNAWLLKKINDAQKHIYSIIMKTSAREIFATSTTITGSSGVFSLPWDYGRVIQFEDENYNKVFPSSFKQTPVKNADGSDNVYYRLGRTFVVMDSTEGATYRLKYYKKPRDLTCGKASGGASGSINLEDAVYTIRIDDYYNGLTLDNYTDASSGTISDYTASSRAATISGMTGEANDYYGTVPDMPDEFHNLIAPFAAILVKEHPASQEKPTKREIDMWNLQMAEALSGFIGTPEDIPSMDLFSDYGGTFGIPVNIGELDYTIWD